MQQMLSEIAATVAPGRRSRNWFRWLGGVGATLVGLKLYSDYNRCSGHMVHHDNSTLALAALQQVEEKRMGSSA